MAEPAALPMFPLGTVLFPHALLPLHVFEPRYRLMTQRVLAGDGEFGVVLIERGSEVGGGDTRFGIGTVARVVRAQELPDGGYALATVGMRRIQVTRWLPDDPFPQAEVADLGDVASESDGPRRARALDAFAAVCDLHRRIDPRLPEMPEIDGAPVRASYEIAALAPIGPLDAQRVLEVPSAGDRLDLLADLLGDHADMLRAARPDD
ncbi:MAG TPA: LON peptidase substrate-binding domain-containing protein [Acidimicrobiia bacterium]|jgi:Lon protease-like protein|nr:LON peptidase substrate-binding domain-containing protein [Acidimicrobiia bacterium]